MSKLVHKEFLLDKWEALLLSAQSNLPYVLSTVLEQGGTRPVWQIQKDNEETMLIAYPAENYVRAAAVVEGEIEGKLDVKSVVPLLEGLATNDLIVEDIYPWKSKVEGEICIHNSTIGKSFWAYDPLFFRDKLDMQIGQMQAFSLSALVLSIQPALLDELTLTHGPAFEKYSMDFLAANPDKSRLDVPPLKIPLAGQQMLGLGKFFGEYQARVRISHLNEFEFGNDAGQKMQMYSFVINLASDEEPMPLVLYAPRKVFAKDFELKNGMDVDLYFWLQARIID